MDKLLRSLPYSAALGVRTDLVSIFTKLRTSFRLEIDAPFSLRVDGKDYQFQCRIRGYGAQQGMVIDEEWEKIAPVRDELVTMGFGYSCFDIEKCNVEVFQNVLDDWGKLNA